MARSKLAKHTELSQFEVHPPSVRLLQLPFAESRQVVILGKVVEGETTPIHVGMLDTDDHATIGMLHRKWLREIIPVLLTPYEINEVLERGYGDGIPDDNTHVIHMSQPEVNLESTVPSLVDDILLRAVATGASDIHIECYRTDVDVRLRIDGVLRQMPTLVTPDNVGNAVTRIKVLANLDVAERRVPQDGRFRVTVVDGERFNPVDFRVSIVPGPSGEDAVLRVLNAMTGLLPIEKLGMLDDHAEKFEWLINNPEGAVFVTGPTGSGKTTTLYSALMRVNDGTRKILTAENPIEYYLEKINQKQVNPSLNMASLARAFLRQDPDVILVGEVRDEETATMVAKAASTGHLVLSTLHTGDTFGAVPRLMSLGLPPDQVAESILAVLAQRLVRRICPDCKVEYEPTPEMKRVLGGLIEGHTFYRGEGCSHCHGVGYRGRVGLYELLVVDEELQTSIGRGEPIAELRRAARARGFRALIEDGLEKARMGITTLDELLRAVPYRQIKAVLDERDGG